MGLRNWKITAWLDSPLCDDAPAIDAVVTWELSLRLGSKHSKKMTKHTTMADIPDIPIPFAQRTISGHDIYCCSDPILPDPFADWQDRQSKRFDTSKNALILDEKHRKNLLVASGPYKQRYAPLRVRLVDRVVWFVRCAKKETNKLLKSVNAIGKGRNYGYGLVRCWDFDSTDSEDMSIFKSHNGKNILMKTVPVNCARDNNCTGYRLDYGAWKAPYWHPENYREIAKPC